MQYKFHAAYSVIIIVMNSNIIRITSMSSNTDDEYRQTFFEEATE